MTNTLPDNLLADLIAAKTTASVDAVLRRLPIVDAEDYQHDYTGATGRWREGHLHWIPVGRDRGNGGRIKLAGHPVNPIAERLVNGMEAIIELERLRELRRDASAPMPTSPREAVQRYFGLPRLDEIPRLTDPAARKAYQDRIDEIRTALHVRLTFDKPSRQFAVIVADHGIGQEPARVHETLLSLGHTDKADKPYLIGVFGQGGSSAFAASEASIVMSRRAPDVRDSDSIGWSVIRQVFPKKRRDPYFAYLATSPEGRVPESAGSAADAIDFPHGTRFSHIGYDWGAGGAAIFRLLYQALNHVLFNPILPYDLFTLDKESPELMQGTGQRLARQAAKLGRHSALDKTFGAQPIGDSR